MTMPAANRETVGGRLAPEVTQGVAQRTGRRMTKRLTREAEAMETARQSQRNAMQFATSRAQIASNERLQAQILRAREQDRQKEEKLAMARMRFEKEYQEAEQKFQRAMTEGNRAEMRRLSEHMTRIVAIAVGHAAKLEGARLKGMNIIAEMMADNETRRTKREIALAREEAEGQKRDSDSALWRTSAGQRFQDHWRLRHPELDPETRVFDPGHVAAAANEATDAILGEIFGVEGFAPTYYTNPKLLDIAIQANKITPVQLRQLKAALEGIADGRLAVTGKGISPLAVESGQEKKLSPALQEKLKKLGGDTAALNTYLEGSSGRLLGATMDAHGVQWKALMDHLKLLPQSSDPVLRKAGEEAFGRDMSKFYEQLDTGDFETRYQKFFTGANDEIDASLQTTQQMLQELRGLPEVGGVGGGL